MRSYIAHHGVHGQKWGIRRGPPYPIGENDTDRKVSRGKNAVKRVLLAAATMSIGMIPSNGNGGHYTKPDSYDMIDSSANKTVALPKAEYAKVMHEVATNITKEQRYKKRVFSKYIGKCLYTFENGFDGTFRVIGKESLSDSAQHYYGRSDDE